jgi:hypothetical protein
MACSSFSFQALQTFLRMCETSTILHMMASICCFEWVASLDYHLVHISLLLSLLGNSCHFFPIWKPISLQLLQLFPLLHRYYFFSS